MFYIGKIFEIMNIVNNNSKKLSKLLCLSYYSNKIVTILMFS